MQHSVLHTIYEAKKANKKLLALLLDPDKLDIHKLENLVSKINQSKADYIFIGGSTVAEGATEKLVISLKSYINIPIVLFPGDYSQLTPKVDAVLFLTLLSGRNPEYLIEQQVKSIPFFKTNATESIATGYILIDGDTTTSTQKVSNTKPISQQNSSLIEHTAIAGEMKGNKLIYLEAGSGAKTPVHSEIIKTVSENCTIPIIVGGGLRTIAAIKSAYSNGADMVVIGTAFEEDVDFFEKLWTTN
ncbi:geranylgeranylglyceryl/heptaprenylglyceryl phosphate synthase [Flavicella marina]|uniref:geranylgeranylglyceryl/heptaprenylglyceryl phosphate synthase n=1 Tax=Flavicella marina TaxID=1475951 RepID=UPI00126533DE|nr:geranylgeranylglyceryl/heptaprenylglyceryl phosphate synthase [Flavicella marina]